MKVRALAAPNGTDWANLVPDSEVLECVGSGVDEWNCTGGSVSISESGVILDGVPLVGIISNSTNGLFRTAGANGQIAGDSVFIAGYFQSAKRAWGHLSISVTDAAFSAHGGNQYFDLDGGVLGSFDSIGTTPGELINAGIQAIGDGFWCWALVNCLGDASRGWTFGTRPVIGDGAITTADDDPDVSIYAGGLMVVDGPSGELPYIPT